MIDNVVSETELATTLHHRYPGVSLLFQAATGRTLPPSPRMTPPPAIRRGGIDFGVCPSSPGCRVVGTKARLVLVDEHTSTCPTCEGECVVDDCPEDTCVCADPPCGERACPDCGGLGSV